MKSLNDLAEESGLEKMFHAKPRIHTHSLEVYTTHTIKYTHTAYKEWTSRGQKGLGSRQPHTQALATTKQCSYDIS